MIGNDTYDDHAAAQDAALLKRYEIGGVVRL